MQPFARRLHRLITHLDLPETKFAALLGVSAGYVNRILNGDRATDPGPESKIPSRAWWRLGLSPEYWTSNNGPETYFDSRHAFSRHGGAVWLRESRLTAAGAAEVGESLERKTEFPAKTDPLPDVTTPPAWHPEFWRGLILRVAVDRGDAVDVLKPIMDCDPPPGAGVEWWIKKYLTILEEAGRLTRGT